MVYYINYIDIGSVENGNLTHITKIDKDYPSRAKRIIKKDFPSEEEALYYIKNIY